jgi:dienelactone hydrolase
MRHRSLLSAFACVAALLVSAAAQAASLGVVLVHGKQGRGEQFVRIAEAMHEAGWLTERPEMCWSRARIYDRPYLDCLDDIDAAVARLRQRGAGDIVVVGMSLGGNAVLAYGALRNGIKGVIALAPAHAPEFLSLRPDVARSLQKARTMVAEGRGAELDDFADTNTDQGTSFITFTVRTSAAIYVSFFAPESPGMMPANAARLKVPLLLVSGTNDPTQRWARTIFGNAPANPKNRFVAVEATHSGTPRAARPAMFQWLKEIAGSSLEERAR